MYFLERVGGIEPPSSAWKADIKSHYTMPAMWENSIELTLFRQGPKKGESRKETCRKSTTLLEAQVSNRTALGAVLALVLCL